jgi:tripartite ATP-independent transporter DctM subunit
MVSQTDIDQLFLGGIIPGILLIVILSMYSVYIGKEKPKTSIPFSWTNLWKALKAAAWEIPMPFIILVGIYSGTFTATEAAAVIAFYVLIIEVFIYKDLKLFKDIPRVMRESMILVGSILIILGVALAFTEYLTYKEIPQAILAFMQKYISNKIMFLIVLNIFLLIVGCLMDIFSAIFVVVPLIYPIAMKYNVDPVHLGIIFLTNLEIGYSTPPVGLNLFIASFRFKQPIFRLYRAAVPFLIMLIFALLLITYIPFLSTFLVSVFGN